jgi:CheY-like chemotaxis protein
MPTPVMLVEDDDDIRETLAVLLEEEGYQVASCRNGREALAALRAGPLPRAILLDLMMPEMDGHEFRRVLLADARLASLPVILITAAGMERVRREDFTEVLRKPIRAERLLEVLARHC